MMKIYGLVFNLFTFYKFETRETLSENIFTAAAHKTQRPVRRTGAAAAADAPTAAFLCCLLLLLLRER
jgi:hypothetical protein